MTKYNRCWGVLSWTSMTGKSQAFKLLMHIRHSIPNTVVFWAYDQGEDVQIWVIAEGKSHLINSRGN